MNSNKTPWEAVNGVLLLNKPRGLTSQQALFRVRRVLRAAKAGHGGTLDPLADGLLMLCFGAATKFAQRHLEADKRYIAVLQLGVRTTTDDAEGEVVAQLPVRVERGLVDAVLPRFLGAIRQIPPIYSALKREGKPLYAYARAGDAIEVDPRTVQVHSIEALALEGEQLTLEVHCGKGTYIRALARDIGDALGCGAHLAALTRTASGGFSLTQALELDAAEALGKSALRQRLLPADALLQAAPRQDLDAEQTQRFLHGGRLSGLQVSDGVPHGEDVRVYGPLAADQSAVLLGIGVWDGSVLAPRRLLCPDEFSFPAVPTAQPPISQPRTEFFHQDVTP
ncbi:MAG: tRNA pseudouridine(55) synthase TruB [Burkholderiaceae bacterium]|nr:tRNA pseudouridine(55) synthase TruB [Burkholderiaceae bacterium]